MSDRSLSSLRPGSGTKASSRPASPSRATSTSRATGTSRPASASKMLLNDHCISRIAIDPSAVLGSFYDVRKECLVGKLSLGKTPIIKSSQQKSIDCIIMKDDTFDSEKLFCKLGIHDETWLDSILHIIPSDGMVSVFNYAFSKNTNTRFFYYYYLSEEQSISPFKNIVLANIPKVIPDITATHIISAIKLGIQALIVLQLSPNDEMNLDCLLRNIAQQLTTNKFQVSKNEKLLLDRITITKIFSNIPDLYKMSTLAEICQKITIIKPHSYRQLPLEYSLRTIQWFYSSYSSEKAKYIPLESEIVKIIKQYLLSLSSKIEELKSALDPEDKHILEERLNEQYDTFRQQITDVEKVYSVEIGRIRELVIKIRRGTIQQELLAEKLTNTFKQSLQNSIDPIVERLQSLREKVQLINNFDRRKIQYLNMQQFSIQQSDDLNTIFQKLCTKSKPELIFCSTDDLKGQNSSAWHDQFKKWIQERKTNSSLTLVYADFTYTSFYLSEVKVLLINSQDDIGKQSALLHLSPPSTSETLQPSTKQPHSSSTAPTLSDTERISSQEKQSINADDQQKPSKSSTLSNAKPIIKPSEQSEEIEEPPSTSISSKQPNVENISAGTKQLNGLENFSNLSTNSPPQPSPRKSKQSTDTEKMCKSPRSGEIATIESITSSKEQINHAGEQCTTSKSQMVSPPPASPRTKSRDSNSKQPLEPTISLKSPTKNRVSQSEEQPDCLNEHGSVPDPSKLVSEAIQPPKEQSNDREEPSESSSFPASSTTETAQSSNKQFQKIERPFSAPTSTNSLNQKETSFQEILPKKMYKQQTSSESLARSISDISLASNQENEDSKESFNSSKSSKRSNVKNASPQTLQFASLEDLTNQSRSSTPLTGINSARTRRQLAKTKNELSATGSSHSSTTESKALSNEQTNDGNELNNISSQPKILTPQAVFRTKNESTNIEEPSKSSITKRTSSSEEQSKCAGEQVSLSKSPEIVQRIEKQSVDTEEQSNQLKSPELSSTEPTSSSERESNHVKKENGAQILQIPSTPGTTPRGRRRSSFSRLPTVDYINILLLGESGVGKSTFINALVNYQAFENFEKARSNEPLVVMPVSFLMTVGDNFEEKIVRFGGIDPNEDHDHPGQSVTQHCKSYVFPIGNQRKLRIIDTPGMGDTRGLEQDDRNMQHILTFINNLPHLNAICILLKPNESRLNIAVRSYFTRLLNFLGENARNNIVFCFTNTRATFFAPGNTGPLLKEMINTLPIKNIPFDKSNTFCFDSESFRYLVALQNGIEFDAYQENEYQQCWTSSSTVSNSLLEYISKELKPYLQNEWQSIEHAQFKINQIIRPVLESTRNILRNITLIKEKSSKLIIKLCPVVPSQPSVLCYKCQRTPKRFIDFWILPDDFHTFSEKCNDCKCSRKKHIDVDYKLEYKLIQHESTQSFEEIKLYIHQLRMTILEFGQFYAYVVDTLKQNDPLLFALKRIITEENQICSEKGLTCLNSTLRDIFVAIKEEYEERRTISISAHVPIDLPSIYEQIESVSKIDEISDQMRAIKQTQKEYLEKNEKQVS